MARYARSEIDTWKPRWKQAGLPLTLALAFFYLGFHAISGERGLVAWFKESKKLETMKTELAEARMQREAHERKIRLLSPSSLDLDMLDERARAVLGFSGSDEIVVLTPTP